MVNLPRVAVSILKVIDQDHLTHRGRGGAAAPPSIPAPPMSGATEHPT
jgi:hypothetical protein